jgi:glycosyltransferase involved in cell wall biosynthesis
VVSESLMCGTPVVVSEMVGAKAVVGPNEGLVVPDLSPETWIAAIRSLASRKFYIGEDFAERHGITLEAHMREILAVRSRPD